MRRERERINTEGKERERNKNIQGNERERREGGRGEI